MRLARLSARVINRRADFPRH